MRPAAGLFAFAVIMMSMMPGADSPTAGHWRTMQRQAKHFFHEELSWSQMDSNNSQWVVLNAKGDTLSYASFRAVSACLFGGCNKSKTSCESDTRREMIYYYALQSPTDGRIQLLRVLEYESNYGFEITSRGWLRQFLGLQPGEAKVGHTIDGLSGATVSVEALVEDVNAL